jgi:hypothetical protein
MAATELKWRDIFRSTAALASSSLGVGTYNNTNNKKKDIGDKDKK